MNTFLADATRSRARELELARGTEDEKQSQLARLADFHERHRSEAEAALARPAGGGQRAARMCSRVLLEASRVCSLGQITDTFFEVGGAYRRNV